MIYDEDIILAKNLLALNIIDNNKYDKLTAYLKENQTQGCTEYLTDGIGVDERLVQQSIATTFDLPEIKLNEGDIIIKTPVLSYSTCSKYKIIPVSLVGVELTVAFVDPPYKHVIEILKLESKQIITPIIISLSNYRNLIKVSKAKAEESKLITSRFNIDQYDVQLIGREKVLDAQKIGKLPPYDVLVEEVFIRAIRINAHDIHFEPSDTELRVRVDKDGIMRRLISFPREFGDNFGNVLKTKAGLNAFEKKKPQEGGYTASFGQQLVDVRVSTLPTIFGERIAVRLFIKQGKIRPIDDLGFSERNLKKFLYLLNKPSGLIIVAGPSASGKSTTIYAAVNELNMPEKNILTVEESIEYKLDFAGQVQAGSDKSFNFADALRAILRHKPNVILVGEIRDAETGIVAAEAALIGNLVLTTMLSSDAIATIPRLLQLGIPLHWLAPTLSGIVYQQLLRTICPNCKVPYTPSKDEIFHLGLNTNKTDMVFYRGAGCETCGGTGYFGRVAVHEVLVIDERLKDLIYQQAPIIKLRETAIHSGFKSIKYSAVRKVILGQTSTSEIIRAFV
jgi:type IV pilus assembly protein PilB